MRQSCLRAAIGSALLLLAGPALARDVFEIPTSFPDTYKDLFKVVKKDLGADEKKNVSAYIDKAQCGGWNLDESVGGKIADVSSVPGHRGQWDGDIPSGMAVRDEDLSYPDGATGLSTACEEQKSEAEKTAWRDDAQGRIPITASYPFFKDPPCLWNADGQVDGPQTPQKCMDFATWTNGYTYTDCRDENIEPVYDDEGNYLFSFCAKWEERYVCSDEWMGEGAKGNSNFCFGAECRCDGSQASCVRSPDNGRPYRSFYRHYAAGYTRAAVPDVKKDVASKDMDIACYGLFDEFDPKTHQTQPKDQRCIINADFKDMKETQKGKGKYGQDSNLADPAPAKRNEGKYDPDKDLWYVQLGQAFSLLNDKLFAKTYGRSLGKVLGGGTSLERAEQKATVQLTDEKPLAEHSYTRAFDETAESRLLTKWWQSQQTRMQTYVHGPVLRLVLPSTWAIGASTDPFLKKTTPSQAQDSLADDSKRIEVQIRAGEDTLGEAVSFIERSLTLQIVEEPMPVVIPLADPVELRSIAASWCAWVSAQKRQADCGGAEGKVKEYMDKLNDYADAIEQYRLLRTELSGFAAELLKRQQDVTKPLTDWLKKNVDDYKKSVESRRRIAETIAPTLKEAQDLLQSFDDETNMPWCMNQRFTLPIYSLLDPWLPSRANGGDISDEGLPQLPDPGNVPEDIILDLSKISYMQSSITIPVLKPTQVRLDLPRPPAADLIPELPDIGKDVQKIKDAIKEGRNQLPKVKQKGSPPSITVPPPVAEGTIGEMTKAAGDIVTLFGGMKSAYDDFWKSIGPFNPDKDEELEKKKRGLECDWGTFPCIHVEMDLVERLTRMGSRPLVMLKEDYDSTGKARESSATCPPEDHVCLLLHPEKTEPAKGWEIRSPKQENAQDQMDALRTSLRSFGFPDPVGKADEKDLPPYDESLRNLIPGILSAPSSRLIPASK